jgi:hypothetical protein
VWKNEMRAEPSGPLTVIALAYQQGWLDADANLRFAPPEKAHDEGQWWASPSTDATAGNLREWDGHIEIWFVVVGADSGEWESLTAHQSEIFFSYEAANAALSKRALLASTTDAPPPLPRVNGKRRGPPKPG